ncbi:DNA-3-methyladenine glycosylase 2 family protein [Luteolibacter ambystomatis]|uniref:DNA-3-methyladenine glycosylase II n=1 Tax=Luteolibacter ambystomatis TaxID=2824561 RepID=A0A975J351_9BACT|nr:DNA-3-methyladenine glycosylase 2 [Luteolibacter ambystomatis]QUE53159.1 DNA-3-methyladenine glycosylase 2 family protein [Luteolibacter ambystomatis]
MIDDHAAYRALASHDPRFDGVFYVGVTSTGVYCRPVCPARTPRRENCRFFPSAAAAEKAAFRPCLRCRPELAPGQAPVDHAQRIAHLIVHRLNEGLLDEGTGLEDLAEGFGISSRQLRRIVHAELGVSPIELMQTRRLLLAKQLLTETTLPVTEIAFASGFASLRRFNDAFLRHYRMPPTRLRKSLAEKSTPSSTGTSTLRLSYRPPYDWDGIVAFLRHRLIQGVEWIPDDGSAYFRTIRLGDHTGWVRVRHDEEKRALRVEFTHTLTPALPALLGRLRDLFDLNARPDLIAAHLGNDPLLADSVRRDPGLRVPGAFDPFEMAVRAILGQQVTVRAATTIACRVAATFGEEFATPFPPLNRLTPAATVLARAEVSDIARLGIVGSRAACIQSLARACHRGELVLDSGGDPDAAFAQLTALPGIGPWTAHYLAMRALRWPDAFPKEDIAIRNRLGRVTAKRAEEISQAWRPWRSYAVMHLWRNP